jgi:hypothetical protein
MAPMAPPPKKQNVPPKKKPPRQSYGNDPSAKKKKAPAIMQRSHRQRRNRRVTKKKQVLVSPAKNQTSARDMEAQKTKPVPHPRKKKAFTKEEETDDDGKKPIFLAVLFLCHCCIIIALVLGLVVGRKDQGGDDAVASSGTGPTMPNVGNSPSVPQPTALNWNPSSPQSSPSGSVISFNLLETPAPTNHAENSSPVAFPVSNPVSFPVSNPTPTDPNPADFVFYPIADSSIQNGIYTNVSHGGTDGLYIENGAWNMQDNVDS